MSITVSGATPLFPTIKTFGTLLASEYWYLGITLSGLLSASIANMFNYLKKWELVYLTINISILLAAVLGEVSVKTVK
jgi:hypothetical protein